MKILILEDNPARVVIFEKSLSVRHSLNIVDNVEDAKIVVKGMLLTKTPFDVIFIDHDLGGEVYVDSEEPNTGYQFAKWLAEKNIKAQFVTHTLNPVGAKNICDALLGKCIQVPFTALKPLLEKGLIL